MVLDKAHQAKAAELHWGRQYSNLPGIGYRVRYPCFDKSKKRIFQGGILRLLDTIGTSSVPDDKLVEVLINMSKTVDELYKHVDAIYGRLDNKIDAIGKDIADSRVNTVKEIFKTKESLDKEISDIKFKLVNVEKDLSFIVTDIKEKNARKFWRIETFVAPGLAALFTAALTAVLYLIFR